MKHSVRTAIIILLACLSSSALAAPRTYGKWGTATDANTTITVPFNPSSICIVNTGSTNDLYVDASDGVASVTDNSTVWRIKAGATYCATFADKNVLNAFSIGVICSAAVTTDYIINAAR